MPYVVYSAVIETPLSTQLTHAWNNAIQRTDRLNSRQGQLTTQKVVKRRTALDNRRQSLCRQLQSSLCWRKNYTRLLVLWPYFVARYLVGFLFLYGVMVLCRRMDMVCMHSISVHATMLLLLLYTQFVPVHHVAVNFITNCCIRKSRWSQCSVIMWHISAISACCF